MRLSVLALDYDGTIARHDRLDPSVLDAIATARTRGITVVLVTGRILNELRRVAGGAPLCRCRRGRERRCCPLS